MPSAEDPAASPEAWREDAAAAHAEAVRRILALIEAGGDTLDLSDLPALEALPAELAGATRLRRLYAGDRDAQGRETPYRNSLADIEVLRELSALRDLGLSHTRITTPPALTGLTALTSLDLSGTRITTPPALTGLASLTSLNLSFTEITTPPDLTGLTALTSLDLSHTGITSPPALTGLSALTSLDLSGTGITTPPDLTGLTALTSLNLTGMKITAPPDLTGLTALTSLDLSHTGITALPDLTGLTSLTSLRLRQTAISDVSRLLLSLPRFAAEQGQALDFADTPAADPERDRRLYMLSRLDPRRCAVETVQYLKGTHPDFRDPPGGIRRGPLAQQLAEASPVGLDAPEGRAEAGNPGAAEKVNPREREQRLRALRAHVAALQEEGARRNLPLDIRARFDRYAVPLAETEPGFVMLDGPMAFLRGGVNDPFVTEGLDGGFVAAWRMLVEMHDALRPFLQPPEEAVPEVAPLTEAATPEDADVVGAAVAKTLREAEAEGAVGPSVIAAADAVREYFEAAKANEAQRATFLRRGLIALGGMVALLTGAGRLAEASIHFQTWLSTPKARWLAERLQPQWERIKSFFEADDDG